jgi:hypothetical protein
MSRSATKLLVVLGLVSSLTAAGLMAVLLPGIASATPTVKFTARAVPIPGFRGTGNILGAGAALRVRYEIAGTEYGGYPPPLEGINFYTPAGTKIDTKGFAVCRPAALQNVGPSACPKKSRVTLSGSALGVVSFGTQRVDERASIQAFFAPGGALQFYTAGSSPVSLEFLSPSLVSGAPGPYGQRFATSVPLIETVPGAPDASALSIEVEIGAAVRHGKRVTYYGRVPRRCPKGGFPLKSELIFAGLGGLAPQTVPVSYRAPCPRGHAAKARQGRGRATNAKRGRAKTKQRKPKSKSKRAKSKRRR